MRALLTDAHTMAARDWRVPYHHDNDQEFLFSSASSAYALSASSASSASSAYALSSQPHRQDQPKHSGGPTAVEQEPCLAWKYISLIRSDFNDETSFHFKIEGSMFL